jgi:hypothetical protein
MVLSSYDPPRRPVYQLPVAENSMALSEGARHTRDGLASSLFWCYNPNVCIRKEWRCPLPDSLASLEQKRSGILTQIQRLGDFRSGSITSIQGRCGKPNCRCHQPNQPGHGPNFRLTRKVNGKTVSESFSSVAELRKAQREVEAFHRFRQLSQELLEVNEKICRARPVEDTLSPQEKKRPRRFARKSRAK